MNTNEFFGQLPKDDFPTEYARLISSDIDTAQANLDNLPDSQRRGLSLDTLRHFHCGFIPDWILTKSRAEFNCGLYLKPNGDIKHLPPPSERIIVPTASLSHFNAIATPSARLSLEKTFWKQHAGTMELFCDPDALNSDLVLVFEGELDAMSIWQASAGSIAAVAILGCANYKKTLLPLLPNLHGKKFILLFDCDQAGLKNVEKLRADLVANGFPAVVRSFFNFLSKDDRKFFGSKVDANDILKNRDNEFLNSITQKIIADSMPDLANLDDEIHQRNLLLQQQANLPDPIIPAPTNRSKRHFSFALPADDLDQERRIISDALKFIPAKAISRDDWFEVGAVLKRYGFEFSVFDQWSNDGDSRYSLDSCRAQWNSFKSADELNGKGNKIGTIIRLAKKFGFVPNYSFNPSSPHAADVDSDILQWQQDNGFIDPQLLTKLKDNAARIDAATDLIAIARDTSSLKFLGAFLHYSCFAHIADSFFAKLQLAHDNAKSKINDYKKFAANAKLYNQLRGNVEDNGKPSEIDFALAALSISAVRNDVKKFKTEAARAHKRYLVQKAIDDAEAKRQADSDNYDKNPNTTQGMIPNCPVDLVLPYGIYLSDNNGIQVVDFEKSVGKGHPVIDACQNPVVPTKIFIEVSTHITQYEIAIKTDDNQWQFVTFDGRTLQDARSVSELANYGAHILNPRAFALFFARSIALNEHNGKLKCLKFYKQPGWHDGKFIFPTGNDDFEIRREGFNYTEEFANRGNSDTLKTAIIKTCGQGGAVARIFIGFALAAPLIRPLNILNSQIQLNSKSGGGKTALAKITAAIFGNPKELIRTFGATEKNRQEVAAAYCDLPTFFDEMETMNGKRAEEQLSQMIYSYAEGKGNQAQKRDGTARQTFRFYGSRLMTAERPILKENDLRGAYKRLVQIRCTNLFNDQFAADLHFIAENNFGHFGKLWTDFVAHHIKEISQTFCGFGKIFNSHPQDVEPTQLKSVTLAAIAFQFFLVCINEKNTFDDRAAAVDIKEIVALLPNSDELDDSARALDSLRSFVASHEKYFLSNKKNTNGEEISFTFANETYGKIFDTGEVAFFPTALRKILEDELKFPSAEKLINEWYEQEKLITNSGRKDRVIKIDKKTYKVYYFKADLVSTDIDSAELKYYESLGVL